MQSQENKPRNYYEILELDQAATEQQIRDAFERLSSLYSQISDGESEPSFFERANFIKEAFEILIDPLKRKEYDASLSTGTDYQEEIQIHMPKQVPSSSLGSKVREDATVAVSRSALQETIRILKAKYDKEAEKVTSPHHNDLAHEAKAEMKESGTSITIKNHLSEPEIYAETENQAHPKNSQIVLNQEDAIPMQDNAYHENKKAVDKDATRVLERAQDIDQIKQWAVSESRLAEAYAFTTNEIQAKQDVAAAKESILFQTEVHQTHEPPNFCIPNTAADIHRFERQEGLTHKPLLHSAPNLRHRDPSGYFTPPMGQGIDWVLWMVGLGPPLLTLLGAAVYYYLLKS